jgi:hypothetical protein
LVLDIVDDITRRLPPSFDKDAAPGPHPLTFARIADGSVNSLGVALEQVGFALCLPTI